MIRLLRTRFALDLLLSTLAVGGLATVVLWGCSIQSDVNLFSDLKTVYGSAWCFAHGQNPYSVANVQAVFAAQGVVAPMNWFGKSPVYPPTTLALLAPFCFIPMKYAVCILVLLSVVAFIAALTGLLSGLREERPITWISKGIIVTLCAAGPLLSFALILGNLSILSAALAILSFILGRQIRHLWIAALLLALALLLKPHLAIWFLLGMAFLPATPRRKVAVWSGGMAAVFTVLLSALLAATGKLNNLASSFLSVLHAESALGSSMYFSSREILPIGGQITSLQSLLGFWTSDPLLTRLAVFALVGMAACWLVLATRNARTEEQITLAVGAWVGLGLLATYHRAHDGIALLFLLPVVLQWIYNKPSEWKAWMMVGLYAAMSFGIPASATSRGASYLTSHSLLTFLALRQAGIVGALFVVTLFVTLQRQLQRDGCSESGQTSYPPLSRPLVTTHAQISGQRRSSVRIGGDATVSQTKVGTI